MDQQHLAAGLVFDQHRGAGHGVAGAVVAELLVPHDFASVLVEGDEPRVQGAEVDLVAEDGRPAVDHVAARANVVGQAVVVGPQAFAGLGIEGKHPRVRAGDVDHAVADDSLGFLAALLLVAEGVRPGRSQLEHVLVIDLGQRLQRWALVPMPYCSTSLVVRWSLAMSSQVTLLPAGAAGAVAAVATLPRARPPASSRTRTLRARGERAGSDLIVMVAVPSGGFGLHRWGGGAVAGYGKSPALAGNSSRTAPQLALRHKPYYQGSKARPPKQHSTIRKLFLRWRHGLCG